MLGLTWYFSLDVGGIMWDRREVLQARLKIQRREWPPYWVAPKLGHHIFSCPFADGHRSSHQQHTTTHMHWIWQLAMCLMSVQQKFLHMLPDSSPNCHKGKRYTLIHQNTYVHSIEEHWGISIFKKKKKFFWTETPSMTAHNKPKSNHTNENTNNP